ncbi:MAG TPA: Rpn family recombination-promoting nuclease/putative transposase [Candidatus Ozemobacteraceae bacterium]|nr:Rpn family recombination-promoting nuclease/putative transposase [Candidatus Ozemobacteraceae bacterium]
MVLTGEKAKKIYPFRNDFVFKFVFGKPGNEEILARLIDALMHFEGDRCIESLELLSPLNLKAFDDDKFTIVDVRAVDRAGRRFSIEMQVSVEQGFEKRMAYYLALLYAGQLREKESFTKLCPAYGIAILDYIMFPGHDRFQSGYLFRERQTGEALPDLMELHFVELPKYRVRRRALRTRLEKWLDVLKFGELYAADRPLPADLEQEKELAMAIRELRRVNADDQMRAILEQRDKEERILITRLESARNEGLEEGIVKGYHSVAQRMLRLGIPIATIAASTGLSEQEIEKLDRKTEA